MDIEDKIKVFISYSHDSDEHKKFVLDLANKLRKDGVDCSIDQNILSPQGPEQGWPNWMWKMIEWADFVLVMFTPLYAKSWLGDGDRRGAIHEGAIITKHIYDNYGKNKKFIPVIPESGSVSDVGFPLSNFTIYTLMKDYDSLLSKSTGQVLQEKPVAQLEEKTGNTDELEDCPYFGLQAFKEENAEFFFGRDDFIHNQLIPAIEENSLPFISLFGASGVGKSSVVFAGLVPWLKRKGWKCVNFVPGNNPFYSLAQTLITLNYQVKDVSELTETLQEEQCLSDYLASIEKNLSQDEKLLIVIDRFEEIYREASDVKRRNSYSNLENQGYSFLRCLFNGITWLKEKPQTNRIVFLAVTTPDGHSKTTDFLEYEELYDPSAHIQLTGLTREEMRQVIIGPAKKKGVSFEEKEKPEGEDLVDIILNDCGQAPGMLPLLEVALRQLWLGRTNSFLITKEDYKRIGGVKSALERYADSIINKHPDNNYQEIFKDIFLQLINTREDLVKTETIELRDIPREELIAKDGKRERWVDFLVENRLLVKKGPKHILSLPHKFLIEYWPKINDWLKQDASKRIFFNDLEKRAESWQKAGRKINYLDFGPTLELTKEFLKDNPNDFRLTDLMKEFHKKGIINKRKNKWKKIIIYGLSIIIPLSVVASLDYLDSQRQGAEIKIEQEKLMHLSTQERLALAVKGKYLSSGEKTHFVPPDQEKRLGNESFNKQEYEKAESLFIDSRKNSLDDPEALIYSNNAKALFSDNYLTIAASVPIKYSNDIAKEMLRGIAQAQDEINRMGGIKGKLLHVVIADDNNDPADVEVIANYLLNDNHDRAVLAVIGSNVSEATKHAADIYQGKMVMISPTSFAVDFDKIKEPENGKNYIFLAINDYEAVMPKLIEYIEDTFTDPKLFVCDDSKAYDQKVFREFFKNKGLSLMKVINEDTKEEIFCDLSNKKDSYQKIIDKAVQLEINGLFIAPHVSRINDGVNLAKYVRAKNPDLKLFGSPTLYNSTTLLNGEVTAGLVIPVHWHPEVSKIHPFYKKAKKLWGEQNINGITWRTAASYDSVYIITTALEKIKNINEVSREKLQEKLADEDFYYKGTLGEIHFEKNGTRKKSNSFLVQVESCHERCSEKNEYKYDFYLVNKNQMNQ